MASYTQSVFINCPFDANFRELFWAMTFTIYRCGFYPRCALEEDNGADNRLEKIQKIISECKYGIHDISNTELDVANQLPRFNMPLELGIFLGAKKYGDSSQKNKTALIFERRRYLYQQYISDLNGVDPRAHNGSCQEAIEHIRNWLRSQSRRNTVTGHAIIIRDYENFRNNTLQPTVDRLGLNIDNLGFIDYCVIVEEYLKTIMSS